MARGLQRASQALMAALALVLMPGMYPAHAQDFQTWNELDVSASWRRVDFTTPVLARLDSQLPNPQLVATGVTVDFHLPWHLALTAGYLFADLPQSSIDVHVPLLALTRSWRRRRFSISDRNRFEKLMNFPTSPVRYRNRILLDYAFGGADRWHAFASDEIFFNLTAGNWNQNRLQAGGGIRLNQHLGLDCYYLRRNARGNAPVTNVLGTTVKLALTPREGKRTP
jgi:hypothetical protein